MGVDGVVLREEFGLDGRERVEGTKAEMSWR
jgi:hypothetical protein